jgi:biopolymer transport protein ExbB
MRNFVIALTAVAAALPAWAQDVAAPVAGPAAPGAGPAAPVADSAVPVVVDPTAAAPPAVPAALVPHDLSPWSMFLSADILVQAVMVGLLFASVLTWTVWLAKTVELAAAKRRIRRALAAVASAATLAEAAEAIGAEAGTATRLVDAASAELHASVHAPDKDGIKERVASRLERVEAHAARSMTRGTGILATIGATAPFVGLFGTVWGIMNSFIGISVSHTTNLAVVAPGIAEALLATACGLFAAIPAVVMYNSFARSTAGYRMQIADVSAAMLRLVSRDLDRDLGAAAPHRLKAAE